MNDVVIGINGLLAILFISQGFLVAAFVRALWQFRRPLPEDVACPPATVVLCLRGRDPFLEDCLSALVQLDYPNYRVQVVVDSREDPAWQLVQQIAAGHSAASFEIVALAERRSTCSLKCSSLLTAVDQLPDECAFVALLDADTIPHRSWLREFAGALADESVGVATGNRWYMPRQAQLGSLVRYHWNAAAVVQMFCYAIPWGGTMAIKARVLRETDVLERWAHAFCEDTMMPQVLRSTGLSVAFVPSLMMVNREACTLGGFFSWVTRQLLTARLYHRAWPLVVFHAVITALVPAAAVAAMIAAGLQGDLTSLVWLAVGLVLYDLALLGLLAPMEWAVRRIVRARGEPTRWFTPALAALTAISVPVTQVLYPTVLTRLMVLRRVKWRGIDYEISPSRSVRLVEYRPYTDSPLPESGPHTSL
ncbi:MAG: glycosyltransferase family 2 protein [Planctomycetota bacterium]|nr:MAG: glycosyltransferase family 2 protein [Planctomycetota bacterium]